MNKIRRSLLVVLVFVVAAAVASATCLPCIKEVLNNGARANGESLHKAAAETVPKLLREGRITQAQADAFYRRAIEIERWYCDEIDKLLMRTYEAAAPSATTTE